MQSAERGTRNGFTPLRFAHKDLFKCGARNNAMRMQNALVCEANLMSKTRNKFYYKTL